MLPTALCMEPRGKITPHVTAYYKAMAVISPIWVTFINLVHVVTAIKPLKMVTGHTWTWFHMLEQGHAWQQRCDTETCGGLQLTKAILCMQEIHLPLCCCTLHWESFHNASLETCPAQSVVSCPAERKIASAVHFCRIWPFAKDLADIRSNSTYLHKITNFTPSPPRARNNKFIHCKLANCLRAERCHSRTEFN